MALIWAYDPALLAALPKRTKEQQAADMAALKDRTAATITRIGRQGDANVALEKEKIAALKWCRTNGNPHLAPEPSSEAAADGD